MPLTEDELRSVAAALAARGAPNQCSSCSREGTMTFIPETAQVPAAPAPNILGTGAIPCAVLVCSNCGFLRFHSLGALRLPALGNRSGR